MVFSSLIFVFVFLPISLFAHFILPKRLKNYALLAASLVFYAWGEPTYIVLMIASIAANYLFGLLAGCERKQIIRKISLVSAVVFNLGMLAFFKYASFIVNGFNGFLAIFNVAPINGISEIALPLGISFYTFQALSYVIDVYRKKTTVQKNPFYVGLYVSLFPQLVAGPIVRYVDVAKEIEDRKVTIDGLFDGIRRFCIGIAKKVLIANNAAVIADLVFGQNAADVSGASAWIGIIAYSIQIYFDFSGYSDMAIGMGKMLGFQFLENFNYPYISKSVKDFWRRWHISLSTWFKDYLYIPLGGNRKGNARTYFNLFIVFLLCGLWHGAAMTFIVWGIYYGVFLIIERTRFGNMIHKAPAFISHIYTLLIIVIGWVFFRSESVGYSIQYISVMFGLGNGTYNVLMYTSVLKTVITLVSGILLSVPILKLKKIQNALAKRNRFTKILIMTGNCLVLCLFVLSTIFLANDSYNPFIYFRF